MKKLFLSITLISILLFTTTSCKKEKLDPDVPSSWAYSKTEPVGTDHSVIGGPTYYVIFQQGNEIFPKMHTVWMAGTVPVRNHRGQMLFGASTTIPIGDDPWNQVVTYFATNQGAPYVVVSHFTDGGPNYESWGIENF